MNLVKSCLPSLLFLILAKAGSAQVPYTDQAFAVAVQLNETYGYATDLNGVADTLLMDIYKPVGDENCLRPVLILIHGGAWAGGSKADMASMAESFAARGWVVASINYRLGTHKAANYTMYAFCNDDISQPCGYIADSAEVYRANFRGMQDAKGAIRFMKSRHFTDSTDVENVYIAGESAGGFVALAAGFTREESQKHVSCFEIDDAPEPDPDLAAYGCIPEALNLSRPDLGSIDGDLHPGEYDAYVKGVGNFYGGVLSTDVFTGEEDLPPVYMFHQGSDVVVHYNYGRLLGRLSWECYAQTNLCQSYHFYPHAWGSKGIADFFEANPGLAPEYSASIADNYQYLSDCFDNGHSLDSPSERIQEMATFFAGYIADSDNDPLLNCALLSTDSGLKTNDWKIYPNPANDYIDISGEITGQFNTFQIMHVNGRVIRKGEISNPTTRIELSDLPAGMYFINLGESVQHSKRFVKL